MSDVQPETSGVQAQYAVRVATDLENNRKEQDRIGAEVAALQEKLQALESDHAVLLSMQEALGSPGASAAAPAKKTSPLKESVPAPRAGAAGSGAARTKKATATKAKTTAKGKDKDKAAKNAPKAAEKKKPAGPAAGPTLVELIDKHLVQQTEPRSAAEITTALTQEHPDRTIKTTVVRTTVEGLVAKGRAHRAKQGSSVFYTAVGAAEKPAGAQSETSAS